jgi:hypothetical protein
MQKKLEFQEVVIERELAAPEVQPQAPEAQAPEPQAPEQKKETRGRKKGGTNKAKTEPKPDSEINFFDEAKKAATEKKIADTPTDKPSIEVVAENPNLVTGYMLLIICDAVIPLIVGRFIAKRTGKKATIKKLDKEQIKEMQPLADAAAKKMFSGVSEVPAFFIAYGCITLTNNIPE